MIIIRAFLSSIIFYNLGYSIHWVSGIPSVRGGLTQLGLQKLNEFLSVIYKLIEQLVVKNWHFNKLNFEGSSPRV